MTLQQPAPADDDPRLTAHVTVYDIEHGGHYPASAETEEN